MFGIGHDPKGNVDADLVLTAMIEYPNYEQAVLITGDGDFHSLARHLYNQGKLRMVLAPNRQYCSTLLRSAAQEQLHYIESIRHLVER
ncbi:MAG: NYN domain-containing protein [Thermomicrobiales bacterium]